MGFLRTLRLLVLGSLVAGAPLIVASAIWGWELLAVGLFGLLGGLAGVGNHRRFGLIAVGFLAITGGLAVSFAWTPILGALLLAGIGLVTGISARWHLHAVLALIGIALGFLIVSPPALPWFAQPTGFDAGYTLAVTAILAVSGAWSVVAIGYLTRQISTPPREQIAPRTIRYFTVALVIALFIGTYVVLRWYPGGTGAWLIMTILIVLQPEWEVFRSRMIERTVGTLFGVAIAGVLVLALPATLHGVVGVPLVLIALAYRSSGTYWGFTTILTPGVVLMVTQGMNQTEALTADGQRLGFTIGAIAVVVAVAALLHVTSRVGGSTTTAR